jgi:hypothetical protein
MATFLVGSAVLERRAVMVPVSDEFHASGSQACPPQGPAK